MISSFYLPSKHFQQGIYRLTFLEKSLNLKTHKDQHRIPWKFKGPGFCPKPSWGTPFSWHPTAQPFPLSSAPFNLALASAPRSCVRCHLPRREGQGHEPGPGLLLQPQHPSCRHGAPLPTVNLTAWDTAVCRDCHFGVHCLSMHRGWLERIVYMFMDRNMGQGV